MPIQNQSYFGQLVLYRARAGKMWALGVNLAQEIFFFFFRLAVIITIEFIFMTIEQKAL